MNQRDDYKNTINALNVWSSALVDDHTNLLKVIAQADKKLSAKHTEMDLQATLLKPDIPSELGEQIGWIKQARSDLASCKKLACRQRVAASALHTTLSRLRSYYSSNEEDHA